MSLLHGQVREIPIRLQELFAKLLLLDQDSVGVEELVNSFGWNNNEVRDHLTSSLYVFLFFLQYSLFHSTLGLSLSLSSSLPLFQASQQHDVQELNRILFDAIESSLVGTARENLTSELFHGVSVQQVS